MARGDEGGFQWSDKRKAQIREHLDENITRTAELMREREKNWLRASVRMEWTWSQLQRAAAARRPLCEKFALDLDDSDVVFDEGSSLVRIYGPLAGHFSWHERATPSDGNIGGYVIGSAR